MPTIHNEIVIAAPPDAVFTVARDVERFPDFMPEVQRVTILEADPDGRRQVVEWVGVIPAFKLTVKWTEEDTWDAAARTCTFRQVRGDFNEYGGQWRFLPAGEPEGVATRFESEVTYVLEIPTIGPLIRGVVRKIMADNVARLQAALKRRCEQ
jgi:coenzyme Q-binding protein COQ10